MADRRLLVLLAALLALSSCEGGLDPDGSLILAPGVTIDEIAIYQGVKRTLVAGGDEVSSDVPLVAGRDAMVRVFVSTDEDYDGGDVLGRLTLGGETFEATATLGATSDNGDLDSTINFELDGEVIGDTLTWSVEVLQDVDGTDNAAARYPASGTVQTEVEGDVNVLRIVIAPFAYHADGSGRLPDTSPEQIDRFRETFLKLYPVSDVEISVREAQPWNQEIRATGEGWAGPGIALFGYRSADGASDDVYYYGMFNPRETISQFCLSGCLLGVTLLNDTPPDEGSVTFRLALGVGFTEQAPWVAAHEIGHAHGRPHTPCGPPGNLPDGIDPGYPYPDGNIGGWGYDIVEGELVSPDDTDIMGYCEDQFVSDYTYRALHDRGQHVNEGWASPAPPQTWDLITIDGDGRATFVASEERIRGVAGERVEVTLLAAGGNATTSWGSFVSYDHLPGGWLMVPRGTLAAEGAEFVIDGQFFRATR